MDFSGIWTNYKTPALSNRITLDKILGGPLTARGTLSPAWMFAVFALPSTLMTSEKPRPNCDTIRSCEDRGSSFPLPPNSIRQAKLLDQGRHSRPDRVRKLRPACLYSLFVSPRLSRFLSPSCIKHYRSTCMTYRPRSWEFQSFSSGSSYIPLAKCLALELATSLWWRVG